MAPLAGAVSTATRGRRVRLRQTHGDHLSGRLLSVSYEKIIRHNHYRRQVKWSLEHRVRTRCLLCSVQMLAGEDEVFVVFCADVGG